MSQSATAHDAAQRLSIRVLQRSGYVVLGAAGLILVSFVLNDAFYRNVFLLAGSITLTALVVCALVEAILNFRQKKILAALADFISKDTVERVITDFDGTILAGNTTAKIGIYRKDHHVKDYLSRHVAVTDKVFARLLTGALLHGYAEEDLPLRQNSLRLKVRVIKSNMLHWSAEPMLSVSCDDCGRESAKLALLTVNSSGLILFSNSAARAILGDKAAKLSDIFGSDGPASQQINTIMTPTGARQCLVTVTELSGGQTELCLVPTEVPTVKDGAVQFDELPVPLLKIGSNGDVLLGNRAARMLLQREISSETVLSDLMEGLGRSIQDWLAEAAAGRALHSEFLRLRREDKEVFVQVSLNRVVEGEESSLIAVLNDATELKTLEAQFVQSQKMQAIGQLAGGVAHDFNNLLTAISGHCDLLLLRHDQGDPDFSDLIQINQNANRAAALVGQLLAFSRKQNLRPEILDMRTTLADLTHLLNRLVGEKVTLLLTNDPVLPSIRADKRQLEQVLMNLVVNARDAMPEGGEIRILTEALSLKTPLERDRVTVPAGPYVSVKVSDDGIGIGADKLQKVFEPFFTTKKTGEGTGLGLSTAYGIVKQTGGYIFVDSALGVGTTFTLLFPVNEFIETIESPLEEPESKASPIENKGGVVLLVEDEAPVRSFASRALQLRGFTVIEAASGEEALELLADASLKVDVFVSDVIMPGLDGPSWVRHAREEFPDVPVIFVSGYAEDSFSDDQARIENSSFLPKPFSLSDLTDAVQNEMTQN